MAQKKKVSAPSSGKAPGKSPAARAVKAPVKSKSKTAAGKPEPKSAKAKPPVKPVAKLVAKPAPKGKAAAKPQATAAKAAKPVPKSNAVKSASIVKPVAAKPVVAKPVAVKPVAAKPAAAKPAAPKPADGKKPSPPVVQAKAPVHAAAKPAAPKAAPAPAAAKPVASSAPPQASTRPFGSHPARPASHVVPKPVPPFRSGPVQFGVTGGNPAARTVSSALPKPAMRSFPAPGAATGAASAMPRDIAQKAVDARQQQVASAMAGATAAAAAAAKKPVTARHGFKINESIVYPAHGVGRIIGIEEQEIAGMLLELFVIQFDKDKMTLKVPSGKLQTVGMRKLAEDDIVSRAMETLKGRARVKRTMWSRRAQEYEAKINSGDLVSIAEVVRDLYRSESQPEQSYSERQLYEAALDRMAREIAAVARIDERGAVQRITEVLSKSAKGRRAAEATEVEAIEAIEAIGEADAKAA